jgi:hypothetical protein
VGFISVVSGGQRPIRLLGDGEMPETLCFDQALIPTLEFVYKLRMRSRIRTHGSRTIPRSKKRSKIASIRYYHNFEKLRFISIGAALVLAAEHDKNSRLSGVNPATINVDLWDRYVATTLSRLGFFDLLNLAEYKYAPDDAIIVEKMVAQSDTDFRPGTEAIKSLFAKIGGSNKLRVDLGSAVTDAVENVVGHAYPDNWTERSRRVPFWWFVGAADPTTSRVLMIIYDQGITIPESMPRKWPEADLSTLWQRLFRRPFSTHSKFDGAAIDAAMSIGVTSTNAAHRGKGLAKIRDLVTKCSNGSLRIIVSD